MNRILPVILLLVSLLLNPAFSAGEPPRELSASPTQEEMSPAILQAREGTDSIQNQESPDTVVVQKGSGQEKSAPERSEKESDLTAGEKEEESLRIPDPFRSWNKAMYHFNDKLYFWVLKPVTVVYTYAAPEPVRILFNNFFDNLKAPARFVNHLLQGKTKAAGNEFVRFVFNSTAGLGGLADAAKELLHIQKSPADFGQTLGVSGVTHGFYLVLPLFGPSSLRDGIGLAVDSFMYPITYLSFTNISFEASAGIFAFETVNGTSFHLGDYEAFKEAAIDPYVSMRSAYVQNRRKAVEEQKNPDLR